MRLPFPIMFLVVAVAAPVNGQLPADRQLLATLDTAISTGAVPVVAPGIDGVTRQLQDAIGNFAKYVSAGDRHAAERALFSLDQAAIRRRTWPWPEYMMARVFRALHDRDAPVLDSDGKSEGESHLSAMWRHLVAALDRDPADANARRMLIELADLGGDRELNADVARVLERDLRIRGTMPRSWIVHGRGLRRDRRYEAALGAFERAALLGGDPAVTALERARTLRALGDTSGAVSAYWSGVADITSEGRALYLQDLEWIVSTDSLAGLRAASDEQFGPWLRRFWAERDAAALHAPDTRLAEHLRRWIVVHSEFRVPLPWKRNFYTRFWGIAGGTDCVGSASRWVDSLPLHSPTRAGDPRIREPLLDHRGFVYMRHGDPFVRTDVAMNSDLKSADPDSTSVTIGSWIYWIDGEWRAFHFGGSDMFGAHAPTTLRSYLPMNFDAWMALADVLPEYARAALFLDPERSSGQVKSCYTVLQTAIRDQRVDASVSTTTDSDSPQILRPWNVPLQFYAIGTEAEGTSRALITFAAPSAVLRGASLSSGGVLYPLTFKIVAYESVSGRTTTIDTVRMFRSSAPLAAGQWLTGWFEVPLPSGVWQVAVRVQQDDPEAGGYSMRRRLVLDRGEALTLSDVVTGIGGSADQWMAAGEPFPRNTLGAWPKGNTVELFYEVRGLDDRDPYTTSIEVTPRSPGQRDRIRVQTPDVASGRVTPVRRSLSLGTLPPGTYTITVTVDAGGRKAVREQTIFVID